MKARPFAEHAAAMERAAQLEASVPDARKERFRALLKARRCKFDKTETQQLHGDGDATDDDVRAAKARICGWLW